MPNTANPRIFLEFSGESRQVLSLCLLEISKMSTSRGVTGGHGGVPL